MEWKVLGRGEVLPSSIVPRDIRSRICSKKWMADEEQKQKSHELRNQEATVVRDIQTNL